VDIATRQDDMEVARMTALCCHSATAVSPAPLRNQLRNSYHAELNLEVNPQGVVESLLTREVARRAAEVDTLDAVREMLEQESARALVDVLPTSAEDASNWGLVGQIAAQDRLAINARQSFAASRAMLQAMHELRDVTAARLAGGKADIWDPDPRFASEVGCCTYLIRRFRNGEVVCRRCQQPGNGTWIVTRRCWQCADCRTQTCIRFGTVMARSHVPLTTWFHAIRIVLLLPTISGRDLGLHLNVRRAATVRVMKEKLRSAMDSEHASRLLAGLDQVCLPCS
jgi:hypothetical protein